MAKREMAKKKQLKIGMIGTGGIAGQHIQFLKNIEGVEVAAACDVRPEALKAASEKYGIQQTFTDYREMLKLDELDGISVCTPNYLHAEPTIAALKAGKHVIVEKPMAMNAKEAQAMVDEAKKAGKVLVIGFQYRYDPRAQMLKRAVDDGKLGKVLYTRCQALRRRGIPNWGVFGRKDLQGGGPLIDIGVHIIEVAHYVMGKPRPVAAMANCFTYMGHKKSKVESPWPNWDHKTYTVEDLAVGMIRFDNGAMMAVESSFIAHIEKNVFNFQIMGEKGGATFDPPMIFTDISGTMFNLTPGFIGSGSSWIPKMNDWIECIRTGKKPEAPGEDGLAVQKILDGLYESSGKGGVEVEIK